VTMASSRVIAVLLACFVLPALSVDPCATPTGTKAPGLTDAEIAGIAVGSVAAVGVIGGGVGAGIAHNKKKAEDAGSAEKEPKTNARAAVVAPKVVEVATPAPTTTLTALDFSSSSGSQPSASLGSIGSGAADSSSFNQGSWADSSGLSGSSVSSGHNGASGSLGSQLPIWLWILVLALCCLLAGGGAAMGGGKKRSKKKKSKAKPAAAEPVAEVEPLMAEIPPLMPLGTSSLLQPSYSVMAAPATTAYAPQYAVAAPMTTAYQQPMMEYAVAAPMTTAYQQPMMAYAAPAAYAGGNVFEATTF